ncbi:MAG: IS21 family transposase [Spirochaetales bacterium]|nr:IS21 family transposase [Spirochaetales bacterium]
MPKARIAMNKIREIVRLKESNLSKRMISRAVGVSRPVVGTYVEQVEASRVTWEEVKELTDDQLIERLQQRTHESDDPRSIELHKQLPAICRELGQKYTTRQGLWEEYMQKHPKGYSYTQFCYHIQQYLSDSELSMHLHHEPGRKLFVDYAGDPPSLYDEKTGLPRKVEQFVSVFPASGLIYTEATESQSLEDFIQGTEHSFGYAGGVPKIITPDNLKAAVTKPDPYEPKINQTYEDFGHYYGCVVIPARSKKPKDKALCEAAVSLVYTRILAPLRNKRFSTLDALNTAIWELLDTLNDRNMKKFNFSRRERFDLIEAPLLSPLPSRRYVMRRFITKVSVHINYHIYFTPDKHYYSVPYQHRRKEVRVSYTKNEIEIYLKNTRIAAHHRDRTPHQYTTTPSHMPSAHRILTEWTPQRFLKWAESIGPELKELIAAVIESREVPEQAFKSCLGILSLEKKFSKERLESASKRANNYHLTTYKAIKRILDLNLDKQDDLEQLILLPTHKNIRGADYYAQRSNL